MSATAGLPPCPGCGGELHREERFTGLAEAGVPERHLHAVCARCGFSERWGPPPAHRP